ncbi:MAG: hypothetical protein OHK0039_24570 [Bacteroidia bacterium]
MPATPLPLGFAKQLLRLRAGEDLPASSLKPADLMQKLVADHVLVSLRQGRNRHVLRAPDPARLDQYLHQQFGVGGLADYISARENPDTDRATFVGVAGDSKYQARAGFRGFLVQYPPVTPVWLGDTALAPPADGALHFILDYARLRTSADTTVVGVENFEVFRRIGELLPVFRSYKPLFVFRYGSAALLDWLGSNQLAYLHFGDWDPAGVRMYQYEFRNRLGAARCRFFIPAALPGWLAQHGSHALYMQQTASGEVLRETEDPALRDLVALLHQQQKGLEQEIMLFRQG